MDPRPRQIYCVAGAIGVDCIPKHCGLPSRSKAVVSTKCLYVARPRDPALLFDFMVRRGFRAITKPSELTTQTELRITAVTVLARVSLSLGSSDNHH